MRAALEAIGFDVDLVKDADLNSMRGAISRFIARIEAAGPQSLAFFYYSGHGAAYQTERGENYIIPVGATITTSAQLPVEALSLGDVIRSLEGVPAKARFVIVDACRAVAFSLGSKGTQKGLVPVQTGNNLLIEFATRPGHYALDDGLFARTLAEQIRQPRLTGWEVLRRTQQAVAEVTREEQVPYFEGVLLRDVIFNRQDGIPPLPPPSPPVALAQDCEACPSLVALPAASVLHENNDVRQAKTLFISKTEVTFDEWDACVRDANCKEPYDHDWGRSTRPVINVSWTDIDKDYLPWLRNKTGRNYRLPTGDEWEAAARGGAKTRYFWGDALLPAKANCRDCQSHWDGRQSAPVASFPANAFGIYDMHGNVAEWTADCGALLPGLAGHPDCRFHLVRGGSFDDPHELIDAEATRSLLGGIRSATVGFRVIRESDN
jgi:hypothetical protein